jgi:hypothetical protein
MSEATGFVGLGLMGGPSSVRFVRTAGGRPGMPTPRHVRHKPCVQVAGPTVWTTIALTIAADSSSDCELVGASSFPRHWVYDSEGRLAAKSGLIDYDENQFHACRQTLHRRNVHTSCNRESPA